MLTEKIYDYFEEVKRKKDSLREEKEDATFNIAPSYLSDCVRRIYYRKTDTPESNPTPIHSFIKFELGNRTHEMVQDILKDVGVWQEGEDFKEIDYHGLKWVYRIDGKLEIKYDNYIVEIKSKYSNGWFAIENEADPDNVLQLYLYMEFEKVERGIILYVGRDNGRLLEYHFHIDELRKRFMHLVEKRLVIMNKLKLSVEMEVVPPREFNIQLKNNNGNITSGFQKDNVKYKSDWRCSYCQWYDLCWKKELEEIKNHKFFIDGKFID